MLWVELNQGPPKDRITKQLLYILCYGSLFTITFAGQFILIQASRNKYPYEWNTEKNQQIFSLTVVSIGLFLSKIVRLCTMEYIKLY